MCLLTAFHAERRGLWLAGGGHHEESFGIVSQSRAHLFDSLLFLLFAYPRVGLFLSLAPFLSRKTMQK